MGHSSDQEPKKNDMERTPTNQNGLWSQSAEIVKSTSPVTEKSQQNGYKNFIMTNEDNNHDTMYTINKNDTNNRNAHDLHK